MVDFSEALRVLLGGGSPSSDTKSDTEKIQNSIIFVHFVLIPTSWCINDVAHLKRHRPHARSCDCLCRSSSVSSGRYAPWWSFQLSSLLWRSFLTTFCEAEHSTDGLLRNCSKMYLYSVFFLKLNSADLEITKRVPGLFWKATNLKPVFRSFGLGRISWGTVCPAAKAKELKMDWG